MLRLLVPADIDLPSYGQVSSETRVWKVIAGDAWVQEGKKYVCVSYAWGTQKVPNTLYGGANIMSSRTLAILNTVVHILRDAKDIAIYLDAFCLPPRGDPSRAESIDEMSHVYSNASEVIVVLSHESTAFLKSVASTGIRGQATMDHTPPLEMLENDPWVTRVWTYQEIANCTGSWSFVAEGDEDGTTVNGGILLNAMGNVKQAYRREHIFPDETVRHADSEVAVRLRFPNIDLFEDVLLGCCTDAPLHRSALQIMANVNRRIRERDEDYFNAMIGAIVSPVESKAIRISWKNIKESPDVKALAMLNNSAATDSKTALNDILQPIKTAFAATQFMQLCEAKGDYSFIFTTGQRSKKEGQRWRPVPGHFLPICSMNSIGAKQPGVIKNGQLQLHEMVALNIAPLTERGTRFLTDWVRTRPGQSEPSSTSTVRRCLEDNGFQSDVLEPVCLEYGYFFPQTSWLEDEVEVFISSSIVWVCGAPGVLVRKSKINPEDYQFLSVGVYIGDIYAADTMSNKCSLLFEGA
jgi:hypothetical protein